MNRTKKQNKTAWILVNVGTPDAPTSGKVRKYLREFLDDPAVIDLPLPLRKFLVHLIIVPFRAPRSARKYREIWTGNGSPLLSHMEDLVGKLQHKAPAEVDVCVVMRYGNPSLQELLQNLVDENYDSATFLPLYPQFANSTTGSAEQMIVKFLKGSTAPARVRTIGQFFDHPGFIKSFTDRILSSHPETFDHILFSYHGLPLRQIQKCHPEVATQQCNCAFEMPDHGHSCYRATCYATSRLLTSSTGIPAEKCSTSFQSRLSRNWMTPFTDETLVELAQAGKKRVLVIPASFVADCLDTTLEIGMEYRELVLSNGGGELTMVESLNSSGQWAQTILQLFLEANVQANS